MCVERSLIDIHGLRLFMTTDAVGGVWPYALDLSRYLCAAGVNVTLAVTGPAPSESQREEAEAILGLAVLPTNLPLDWTAPEPSVVVRAGADLARLAVECGAHLVHLNSAAYAAENQFAAPLLIACHSCVATWWDAVRAQDLPTDFIWRRDQVAKGYAEARMLVAPSHAFAEATRRVYGRHVAPRVVYNGRTHSRSAQSGMALPSKFAFTAGRLWDEGKNLKTVDRAAALTEVPVLAAGSLAGPNGVRMELPNLQALGQLDSHAIAACFDAASVFVSPAYYEPFGFAVLEAARSGTALILSNISTFREIWGEAASYVPCDDAEALAGEIERLIADPDLRSRRAAEAQRRAIRYGVEAMGSAMLSLYAEVLAGIDQREGAH
jgi:glycosyltransferase involved in cell wall biosynthesis